MESITWIQPRFGGGARPPLDRFFFCLLIDPIDLLSLEGFSISSACRFPFFLRFHSKIRRWPPRSILIQLSPAAPCIDSGPIRSGRRHLLHACRSPHDSTIPDRHSRRTAPRHLSPAAASALRLQAGSHYRPASLLPRTKLSSASAHAWLFTAYMLLSSLCCCLRAALLHPLVCFYLKCTYRCSFFAD